MDPQVAIVTLEREAASFAALLQPDLLQRPVPSCPGWTLGELARHLGRIHRWARTAILDGPSDEPEAPSDPEEVRPWLEQGAADLAATLRSLPADSRCWTFADPPTVGFWMRRQAHETALHHWDAAASLGRGVRIDDTLALDGIDEVVTMFLPRQLRLGRLRPQPGAVELRCSSGPSFAIRLSPDQESTPVDASVTADAEALLLLLWKRTSLDDDRLTVSGSRAAAETLLAQPLTP